MLARLLPICLLFAACASLSYRSPGPYSGGSLLGPGSYLAEIVIQPNHSAEEARFNAVFARHADATLFDAVAPSGKPLFRVRDQMAPGEPPALKLLRAEPPVPKATLDELYGAFRPLLLLTDKPNSPAVVDRYDDGRPKTLVAPAGLSLRIEEYDWAGHAFRLVLAGGSWSARITLREYDLDR